MKSFNHPVVVVALLLGSSPVVQGQVSELERSALIEFYHATDGDNWIFNSGWLGPAGTECDWAGVYCHEGPNPGPEPVYVHSLELRSWGLRGTIPRVLADLRGLRFLELPRNLLTGKVPQELLELTIQSLDLAGNQLSGFEPVSLDPVVSDVGRVIRLAGNALTELPPQEWLNAGPVGELDMSGNQLQGALVIDFETQALRTLKLSGNDLTSIEANWESAFPLLEFLDLSSNALAAWPPIPAGSALKTLIISGNPLGPDWPVEGDGLIGLERLEVAQAGLDGPLPEWFSSLNLIYLDLSDNGIEAPIDEVLAAMRIDDEILLKLYARNNRLSGVLPSDFPWSQFFDYRRLWHGQPLDLCQNNLSFPNQLDLDALEEFHRGYRLRDCQIQSTGDMGPTLSGTWYYPETSGEGFSQMLIAEDQLLVFWFTYPTSRDYGLPSWYIATATIQSSAIRFDEILSTRGEFGQGGLIARSFTSPPQLWMDQIDDDHLDLTLEISKPYVAPGLCPGCPPHFISDRVQLQALTRLAGSRCDNQQPHQWISGVWFNPELDGEGFVVEVTENGDGVVYWFTYASDSYSTQAWMIGQAEFNGNTLEIPELLRPRGGSGWSYNNPERVQLDVWGSLTLEFTNDLNGHISYDSVDPDFGSGSYPIERLARPMLAECE